MCKHGDYVDVTVQGHRVPVDRCLIPYVKALNSNGIRTTDSCCGHGERLGYIRTYCNGQYREIVIFPTGDISLQLFDKFIRPIGEHFDAIRQNQISQGVQNGNQE